MNDRALERMVKAGIKYSTRVPENLGAVLCGLGELAAKCEYGAIRSEYDIDPYIRRWLSRHRRKIRWPLALSQATSLKTRRLELRGFRDRQREAESIGTVDHMLSHKSLTPGLWNATLAVNHGRTVMPSMREGLRFTARMALCVAPSALMRWARKDADKTAQWAVIDMLENLVVWSGRNAMRNATSLLETKDPLGIMLAARVLINPPLRGPVPALGDIWRLLLRAGIPEEDACWLCSPAISTGSDRLRQASMEVEHLEKQRVGFGAQYPAKPPLNSEIDRLETELEKARAYKAKIADVDVANRRTFAAILKHAAISLDTWELIVRELPSSHAERQELAIAIGAGEARRRLLDRNVDDLLNAIGAKEEQPAFLDYFALKKSRFFELSDGAAQALMILAADNDKNIGKWASQGIAKLATAAGYELAEPFIRSRHHTRWQSALGRFACAVAFAFAVADALPVERHPEIRVLTRHALGHARNILKQVPEPFDATEWWFEHLSLCMIRWTDIQGTTGEMEAIALDESQPFLARSLALWSGTELARKHTELALECFEKAHARSPGEMAMPDNAMRAVRALDLAVGCCGADEVAERLIPVWDKIFSSWRSALSADWSTLCNFLILAVRGVEPCRTRLLGDGRFRQSQCRSTIEDGERAI
ncbi:hypothetical protein HGI47_21950 [Novosphingobium sp. ERN07]|uniref:hypothetical protein n=1 Tax=Novosphingobium sp. ERN07 TaxID=2726187 RepID=UPI0014568959|nr:hypothetical protein [Novosphingobium sp. ERN07]NLR73516.1 hypothetical protein [Novosphingobium sp. ERN07]